MSRDEILQKLQEIFIDVFEDETLLIKDETNACDVEGWDSLKHIIILEAVQDEFGITFGLDEMIDMKDVGDMVTFIYNKL